MGHNTPVDHVSAGKMELRPRPGVSGLPVKPRATSLDRNSAGLDKVDDVTNETLVNLPSSATGVTRGGKSPSRILPAEGGWTRTSSPQPRSETAGGADRSPEGDSPRRRGQTRESGDAGGSRAVRRRRRAAAADILLTPSPPIVTDRRAAAPPPPTECRRRAGAVFVTCSRHVVHQLYVASFL